MLRIIGRPWAEINGPRAKQWFSAQRCFVIQRKCATYGLAGSSGGALLIIRSGWARIGLDCVELWAWVHRETLIDSFRFGSVRFGLRIHTCQFATMHHRNAFSVANERMKNEKWFMHSKYKKPCTGSLFVKFSSKFRPFITFYLPQAIVFNRALNKQAA